MSRLCRLDWNGAVHHVISRGVAKCPIFEDRTDRLRFLSRLSELISETDTTIMAWVLMRNHIHLLTRTAGTPLSKLMQRLLTGHAVYFNLKHDRTGHLFQNRYKSILVQEDLYLKRLIRYIHRNPIRAGVVGDVDELREYPWCGHAGILDRSICPWMNTEQVLERFGEGSPLPGRFIYQEYMRKTDDELHETLLETGNFRIGNGGLSPVSQGNPEQGGYRILGSREYGLSVLKKFRGERGLLNRSRGRQHSMLEEVLRSIEEQFGLAPGSVSFGRKTDGIVRARETACYVMMEHIGLSPMDVAGLLDKSVSCVSKAADRMAHRLDTGDPPEKHIINEILQIIGRQFPDVSYVP